MDKEKLNKANELAQCLQTARDLLTEFNKEYPAVNQVGSTGLTHKARIAWKNANIEFFANLLQEVEQEFEEL